MYVLVRRTNIGKESIRKGREIGRSRERKKRKREYGKREKWGGREKVFGCELYLLFVVVSIR